MGEFVTLIKDIKKDKNKFVYLIRKMDPLINKYVLLLYKDEKEDIYAEMTLALWESFQKLNYYEEDGQIIKFLSNALRNRFLELYKQSKKNMIMKNYHSITLNLHII